MAWIFGLAIGTVILSLLVRHSLAAKDESVAQASPELVTEYPSVGVFLDHNDRTVIPAAQLQWQEPAWDSLAAYLKSPTFQNSIKTFVVREKWQGAKFDDVMAVQTNQVGATACNHMVRNGEAFAVHPKIPCGSRLTVRANDRSIVVPVWDRPATTTPWLQIQLGLSTKAMQELGLSGKAQLSFEVTSTPSS